MPRIRGCARFAIAFTLVGDTALTTIHIRPCESSRGRSIDNSHPAGMPERPKGADCKSAGIAFGGSNPSPGTCYSRLLAQACVEPDGTRAMLAVCLLSSVAELALSRRRGASKDSHGMEGLWAVWRDK